MEFELDPARDPVRKAQKTEDGSWALIEHIAGVDVSIDRAGPSHTIEMTDKQWQKVRQADRTKHDLVLEKGNKTLTLRTKIKRDKE